MDDGEAAWEGAEEEEVMVLVDLPEFGGTDVFKGARSLEIRVRGEGIGYGGWGRVRIREWIGGAFCAGPMRMCRGRSLVGWIWPAFDACFTYLHKPTPPRIDGPHRTWRGRAQGAAKGAWSWCWTGRVGFRGGTRTRWAPRWWWTSRAGARRVRACMWWCRCGGLAASGFGERAGPGPRALGFGACPAQRCILIDHRWTGSSC